MTVSEFLDRLYETPRTWRLNNLGQIDDGCGQCPGAVVTAWRWPKPAGFAWIDVFMAADNKPDHDPKIRRALLHACGLTQEMP